MTSIHGEEDGMLSCTILFIITLHVSHSRFTLTFYLSTSLSLSFSLSLCHSPPLFLICDYTSFLPLHLLHQFHPYTVFIIISHSFSSSTLLFFSLFSQTFSLGQVDAEVEMTAETMQNPRLEEVLDTSLLSHQSVNISSICIFSCILPNFNGILCWRVWQNSSLPIAIPSLSPFISNTEQTLSLSIFIRSYCWAHLAQLSSDKAVEIVELILNYCPKRCKIFSKLYDEHGRQVWNCIWLLL